MTDNPMSFEHDIRPLFRPIDIEHMKPFDVRLDDYAYMSDTERAERVYSAIESKQMPPPDEGFTWPEDDVRKLRAWIDGGCRP